MPSRTSTILWSAAGLALAVGARRAWRKRRSIDLRGRTVLISGGSRGLGLVLARHILKKGSRVAICARDAAELEQACDDLRRRGGRVLAILCNITDRAEVESLIERVQAEWGPIDVLINNAGVIQVGPVETMCVEDFEEAMAINYWGAVYTTMAVMREMRKRHCGRIVNIASIGGKVPVPHLLPYCASKFAVTAFSEGLHAEVAKDGVIVITVCPHLMRTGSPPNASFKGKHRAEYRWFALGDSLPFISMSAERAARRIVRAIEHGETEVILSLHAKVAARLFALAPGTATAALGMVNRLLPKPGGIGTATVHGKESCSALTPSLLTTLGDRAAVRNNENP